MNRCTKITFVWLVVVLTAGFSFAQNKKLTVKDAVMAYQMGLYPTSLEGVQWKPQADEFSHVKKYSEFYVYDAKNQQETKIFGLADLNKALEVKGIEPLQYIPFWSYKWASDTDIYFQNGSSFVFFNVTEKKVVRLIEVQTGAENIQVSPDFQHIAFTIANNLFVVNQDNEVVQITNDTDKAIVNGNGYTHRQEFGITEGSFWSADGKKLAFYRKDETMVTDYPIINIEARVAQNNPIKYPMAGMKSEEVKLMIFDLETQKTTQVQTGEPVEQYLTNISWSADNKSVFIAVVNREQNHMKLNQYDSENGQFIKTLFEEKNKRYVEPEHPMHFVPNTTDLFIWQSERDGYNHLYLYNTDGKLIRQLTKGEFVVTGFNGFDKDGKVAFYTSTQQHPLDRDIFSVSLKNAKSKRLTAEKGVHTANFSYSGMFFVNSFSNLTTPGIYSLNDNTGKQIAVLHRATDPTEAYKNNMGALTLGSIKAADGTTDLYYRLITPPNFDANKKYPTIVYVYGGPHLQLINNSWMSGERFWPMYMAQEGYVVFSIDNRGSANRGFEFESVIHRQLGVEEMKDQMKGIEYLKSLAYVDADRIGVHGWSFGGYMTISQMLNYPNVYKVGVAGGPVIDWKYYEVMYGERYMDTPQENPEGYAKTSLLDKVSKLNGKLLVIHGGIDPVVVKQHSDLFIRRSVQAGVYPDYFPYPTHEHNVRGKDRVHLMQYITNYFEQNLK